jgi:flagellar biosynthesis anti-sigma factor FlgM
MPIQAKGKTTVKLFEASRYVQRAKQGVDVRPDNRLEKVRTIREEILRGEYRIEYERIAENLLCVFIDEMSADRAVQSTDVPAECISLIF